MRDLSRRFLNLGGLSPIVAEARRKMLAWEDGTQQVPCGNPRIALWIKKKSRRPFDRRLGARDTTQYIHTVMVQTAVSKLPALSTTLLVKVYVPPVTVGDPLITPVELFSVRPGGSEPETIE